MGAAQAAVRKFDEFLARQHGIRPFTQAPEVIVQVNLGKAPRDLPLDEGVVRQGAPVVDLHLWNGRLPNYPAEGPNFHWGIQIGHGLKTSLQQLAAWITTEPGFNQAQAIGGYTVLFSAGSDSLEEKLFQHFGFQTFPYHRPGGRFGEWVENCYTWTLMWAYNPASVQGKHILQISRSEVWMSRLRFSKLYAKVN